ncbi:accessory gland protein Acp32CD [Drosophila tropicalis]|uniref:accessory gland protein Acp32CD n=1 Tax=Drosophila tropicalis TaxID=46794 RepID=UPI0035ABEC24
MRTRIVAFALLAFCQLHLQNGGVLGQKYYMNFAFNNNNPDGGTSDDTGGGGGGIPGQPGNPDSHESHEAAASQDAAGGSDHSKGISPGNKSDNDKDEDKSHLEEEDDNEDSKESNEGSPKEPPPGTDDDDDDSDSKDAPGRRERERQKEENVARRTGDHSHHSSYEISIDDSFGGRYVRSIYESSESHGHSGSKGGSGSGGAKSNADSGASTELDREAHKAQENGIPKQRTLTENDYEEFNDDV